MAAEQQEEKTEEQQPKAGKKKPILIIIIAVAVILAGVGGFFGYTYFSKSKGHDKGAAKDDKAAKATLIALDPFVVNLSDPGRYLKVTLQLEIEDPLLQQGITEKMPKLRDAIITLLSSKSSESVSGPEGKFQLKDELLLRVNQAVGKDTFKNLYFTEFVMQ